MTDLSLTLHPISWAWVVLFGPFIAAKALQQSGIQYARGDRWETAALVAVSIILGNAGFLMWSLLMEASQ